LRWDDGDLLLSIRVLPRSATQALAVTDGHLKVSVTSPPVDGKANKQVCALLAKAFGVGKSRVVIERGDASRHKRVRIRQPQKYPDWLDDLPGHTSG
jgi:uncharacterized protein (TIGR00251 family)